MIQDGQKDKGQKSMYRVDSISERRAREDKDRVKRQYKGRDRVVPCVPKSSSPQKKGMANSIPE